jgi:hypothetical protein
MVIGKRLPPGGVVLKRKLFQSRSARRLNFFALYPRKTHAPLNPAHSRVAVKQFLWAMLIAFRRSKSDLR